jgi:hypothetical protein
LAINAYLQQVQRLLNNPTASLYNTADLIVYINIARGQIAGEGECIRQYATLAVATGTNIYNFTAFTTTTGIGIQGVLNIRMAQVSGQGQLMESRPWEWLNTYYLTNTNTNVVPSVWAQYAQGSLGTFFVAPTPSSNSTIKADTICYPINLNADSDPEGIPWPWTDAIPFFAAFLAYLNAQRDADAQNMYARYEMFMRRARQMATPTVLPLNFPGSSGAQIASQMGTVTGSIGAPGGSAAAPGANMGGPLAPGLTWGPGAGGGGR